MELKLINANLRQVQIAKELCYSISTIQRCRHDIKLHSSPESNAVKRPQITSNDLKIPQKIELIKLVSSANSTINRISKKKSKLKGGSVQETDQNNDEH